MGHGRRHIFWFGVTANPTAEWIANQVTEACGWEQAPRYLIRDRDGAYGEVFIRRVRSMGIRDRPTSPHSPWQNGYAERLIGSIRRECYVRRATPPSCTAVVRKVSQRDKDAFIFGEGCAGVARRPTGRDHSLPPGPGRAAPPICSDLIYDRHTSLTSMRSISAIERPACARALRAAGKMAVNCRIGSSAATAIARMTAFGRIPAGLGPRRRQTR
jgi:hypothetical protein